MTARIFLRPYRAGDERAFTPRADFAEDMTANGHDWRAGPPAGITWSVVTAGGRVQGLAGAMEAGPDAVQVWACLVDMSPSNLARCVGLAREKLAWIAREMRPQRLLADARADQAAAIRCLERLGFTGEGERRAGEVVYVRMGRAAP